jgi:hypothetical protein
MANYIVSMNHWGNNWLRFDRGISVRKSGTTARKMNATPAAEPKFRRRVLTDADVWIRPQRLLVG